jgi:hypothetical protein
MVGIMRARRRTLVFVAVAACLSAGALMALIGYVGMTTLAGF